MKKPTLILLGLLMIIGFSGCNAGEEAGQAVTNTINEAGEAYDNVVTKIDDTKNWFNTKVDQVDKATNDINEAASSINQAVDSLKSLSDLSGPSKVGESETPPDSSPVTQ